MHRVQLTPQQEDDLFRRTRAADLKPRTRDRLEMVRLAAAGHRVRQIACLLRMSASCVRRWLRRFRDAGFDALPDRPHPGRPGALTPELLQAMRTELAAANRTWTARRLAHWLEEQHGVRLTPSHLASLLKRAALSYKRTERSLKHKQDPEAVALAQSQLAELEKGGSRSARPRPPGPSRLRADIAH